MVTTGGLNAKINDTRYYKVVADLLGGEYFVNVDNFADRDYAATPYMAQNDLDYYLAHGGDAQILKKGDEYGYNYYAHIRNIGGWVNQQLTFGNLNINVGGRVGYQCFWREGLLRKGLFPGETFTDPLTNKVVEPVTTSDGEIITSKGNSKKARFVTFAGKLGLNYLIGGNMRVYANVGYYNDAPTFNQAFVSPRTRNTMVQDLTTIKTFSSDINWQYSGGGINIRATGYFTTISDQSKIMSAYDDVQNAFSNFALSGINQRHMGVELGFKFPTYIVPNLNVQGVVAFGEAIYTSNPTMMQTLDNSATPVLYDDQDVIRVKYWKESPVYKKDASGNYTDVIAYKQKHYVPSTPQTAISLGLNWNYNYWFVEADVEYFDRAYLDMNPLYRTEYAVSGPDREIYATAEEEVAAVGRKAGTVISTNEVEAMASQEKFAPAFLLNASVGKSWFIQRKYQLGFSLNAKNLLNAKNVKTGGYEQTRMVDNTASKSRYYRFDSKYFYMQGINYMLNIYFRF